MSVVRMAGRPMPTASDNDLVQASQAGDDEAFEELYRRYHARISAYVRRLVRDEGRSEDVIQEAFVSALRCMRRSEGEIQFKPWIYEIAHNKAIDAHRRANRGVEVSFDLEAYLDAPEALRPVASHAPEASLMERERFDNFRGALDELSDTQHRIILLRELEGLSYREIGARMGLSCAAVESALFRARRKLEHEYEQLETGRRCRLVRASIARLAEGVESGSDRRKLDRHARRCWSCRRCAHQLGVEPISQRAVLRGVGALLPLPAFLRRLLGGPRQGSGSGHVAGRDAAGAVAAHPGLEAAAQGVQKAAAVVASAVAIGGGGATLGGVGPLAVDGDRTAPEASSQSPSSASRVGAPSRGPDGRAGQGRSGPSAASKDGARAGRRHRRGGAAERSAPSNRAAPSTQRPAASSTPSVLPPVDADGLLAPAPRGGAPALPQGGSAQPLGNAESLPNVPAAPTVPTELAPPVGGVEPPAPALAVGAPKLDPTLPLP